MTADSTPNTHVHDRSYSTPNTHIHDRSYSLGVNKRWQSASVFHMSEINNPTTYLGMGVFWQKYLISAGGVTAAMLW